MFRHWSAILRESTWIKEHKSNTLIQVLILEHTMLTGSGILVLHYFNDNSEGDQCLA